VSVSQCLFFSVVVVFLLYYLFCVLSKPFIIVIETVIVGHMTILHWLHLAPSWLLSFICFGKSWQGIKNYGSAKAHHFVEGHPCLSCIHFESLFNPTERKLQFKNKIMGKKKTFKEIKNKTKKLSYTPLFLSETHKACLANNV